MAITLLEGNQITYIEMLELFSFVTLFDTAGTIFHFYNLLIEV